MLQERHAYPQYMVCMAIGIVLYFLLLSSVAAQADTSTFDYSTCQAQKVHIIDENINAKQEWIPWNTFKTDFVYNKAYSRHRVITTEVSEVPCAAKGCCNMLFSFRYHSTDALVFEQIFGNHSFAQLYKILQETSPKFILDAGGNCGFASSLFAMLLPNASAIISLEPDRQNFLALTMNSQRFPHVKAVNAALWSRQTYVEAEPADGDWGYIFKETSTPAQHSIYATTIPQLMRHFHVPRWDIAKIDIEGAESRVFSPEADTSWINVTKVMVMELHDWMAGHYGLDKVSDIVYSAMSSQPHTHVWDGEHIFYLNNQTSNN